MALSNEQFAYSSTQLWHTADLSINHVIYNVFSLGSKALSYDSENFFVSERESPIRLGPNYRFKRV